jgi:hypothetical protein
MTLANWFLNWLYGTQGGSPSGSNYLLLETTDRIALEDGGGFLKLE